MQIAYLWSVALQTGNTLGIGAYVAHGVVGIFAGVLCSLSLYAWFRRKHVGLQLVSLAFFVFCLKEALWFLSQTSSFYSTETGELTADLITVLTDLIVLVLFFAAIMLRPRKQLE